MTIPFTGPAIEAATVNPLQEEVDSLKVSLGRQVWENDRLRGVLTHMQGLFRVWHDQDIEQIYTETPELYERMEHLQEIISFALKEG